MPARLIRDDMLDSERVQTLPVEARWLYVTVLLSADDLGLFEVNHFRVGRRAGIDQNKVGVLIQLLADSDLIRVYEADGKRFGFIPRFRQRLQIKRSKHPMPPAALMSDDKDAISKINDLEAKARLGSGGFPCITDAQPSEPEPEPEAEIKTAPTVLVERKASDAYRVPDCPYDEIIAAYHERLPALPKVAIENAKRRELIRGRWREVCAAEKWPKEPGVAFFRDYFSMVARSRFLTGRTDQKGRRPFIADLEWLMRPSNFAKTLEGRYTETA